ncbi:FadR/GntR family transcriptional regulator [Streptomyces zagrosensis]|uniref:DNA-binding FadR family transcriptional regulator n=1 Tax=Streptomyces zagrosensis TaxID=1042984 RepID=A0A7W9QD52_9ACTN|nr:FCD domain-containing protein [Streptomyces zagrosensis]MBB5937894.1 DNA-binding FadR family transcriptional regulator [Streptomyces zagrosensis]
MDATDDSRQGRSPATPAGPGGREGAEPPALRRGEWERPAASRAEVAAERIAALVADAEPGARLGTKHELRAECGVSVGTFNETLRLLQSRGLVTVRPGPGGGLFAAEQSAIRRLGNSVLALDDHQPDEVCADEALHIRDALDPLLANDALWHASPADIADLRGILADLAAAVENADAGGFADADRQLRTRLAAISPNSLLRSMYATLLTLAETAPIADREAQYARHVSLVDALETRDRAKALNLMRLA